MTTFDGCKSRRDVERQLVLLMERLVAELLAGHGIREGQVMSLAGVAPYRRLDCDGRALCYLRVRPLKKAVRVDLSGLWRRPPGGAATMLLASDQDVDQAVAYLRSIVAATRKP